MTPFVEEMSPAPDPVRCCEALEGLPYRLFLDSASTASRFGRYSFLTADPVAIVRSRGVEVECLDLRTGARREISGDPLVALRELVMPHAAEPVSGLPPFQGGAAGYVAYDWGLTLERLPAPRYDDLGLPDLVLGLYDWVIAWDHESSRAWLISTGIPERTADARRVRAASSRCICEAAIWRHLRTSTLGPPDPRTGPSHPRTLAPFAPSYPVESDAGGTSSFELRSSFTRSDYLDAVSRVREYIFAGDIFQANLSQRFEAAITEPRVVVLHAAATTERGAVCGLPRLSRSDGGERIAGALPACRCPRPRRDAPDQRDAAARSRPRARRGAGPGAGREREGSRREPDDR